MIRMEQFVVFHENRPGTAASIYAAIAASNVNILAMAAGTDREYWVTRMLVDDPEIARTVLEEASFRYLVDEVLVAEADNKPGTAAENMKRLTDADVEIDCLYCTGGHPGGKGLMVFGVSDVEKAIAALERPCSTDIEETHSRAERPAGAAGR